MMVTEYVGLNREWAQHPLLPKGWGDPAAGAGITLNLLHLGLAVDAGRQLVSCRGLHVASTHGLFMRPGSPQPGNLRAVSLLTRQGRNAPESRAKWRHLVSP